MGSEYTANEFKIPESKEQWDEIKRLFLAKYDLIDEPETWIFVLSQIQGTKMPALWASFSNIHDHYKRWKIAEVLQTQKVVEIKKLEDRMKEALLKVGDAGEISPDKEESNGGHVPEGSFDLSRELHPLQNDS